MYRPAHLVVSSAALATAVFLATGCVQELDVSATHQAPEDHVWASLEGCPPEACGFNGVRLAEPFFGPLRLDGAPNQKSFAIVDFLDRHGTSYGLDVHSGSFVGLDRETGQAALTRHELIGSAIVMAADQGPEWTLTIQSVTQLAPLSHNAGEIPGYTIDVRRGPWPVAQSPAATEQRLDDQIAPDAPFAPILCAPGVDVVLFAEQESYDPVTLDPQMYRDSRRLTLACADDLLGKVVRMGLDSARAERTTRTAALRMLRADYCGTGRPFTAAGTALSWQSRDGIMPHGWPESADAAEAAWDEHGALCLNQPRLAQRYSRSDVILVCGFDIPRCSDEILATASWVSW